MLSIKYIIRLTWVLILLNPINAAADVIITGLTDTAETNVKLTLSLAQESCDAPEWKIRQLFTKADQEIDEALRALGYYHVTTNKQLQFIDDCWQAEFAIQPGPQVIVDNIAITIEGDARDDTEFIKLQNILLSNKGMSLHHGHYETMKDQIESLAMERGYLKGHFVEKNLLVDIEQNTAQILLVFDAGKRMYFGDINIDQDILDPDFVHKFVTVKQGEFYTSAQLAKTHNDLSKSGYFDMVDIHPEMEQIQQNQVPINLKLYPKKTHHYSVGFGYDTDKGPLLGASYINRRLNRRGHYLTSDIDLSPVLSTADLEYNVPLENPMTEFFSFGGGLKREDTDTYKSLSGKLSARLKHALESGWKQTLFVDSVYESFTADSQDTSTLLLLPGGSWLRSVADNPLRPTKGYRVEFNIAGSYKNPLSDISMAQGSLSAVWTHPMPWNGRLIARAEQGATMVNQFDKLPTTYRFYAGGMNSIRGYSYKELGPKDDQGHVVGGRFLSVVSVEYEQAILENWGVAAFIDSGNAYNLDDIRVKTGVGLGARWYSPIGLVRVDVAVPLDEADSSFQFHFAAGTRL